MVTLEAINNEYKKNIDNLNQLYNYHYNRIRRLRIHPYYKGLYFQRLYNFYRFKLNEYKIIYMVMCTLTNFYYVIDI